MKLEVNNLCKNYGETHALAGFSYTFGPGIYGLLGGNGAGKSTLMSLLTDNLVRTGGEIRYNDVDILTLGVDFRKKVGYMPQQQGYYPAFTAEEYLRSMASLKCASKKEQITETEKYIELLDIEHFRRKKMQALSGGMRQRVLLAQALIAEPEVLILDEPTAGLDPKERVRIRNLIYRLSRQKIIIIATHIVSDIECIAKEIILQRAGRIVASGTPEALIASLQGKVGILHFARDEIETLQEQFPCGIVAQGVHGMMLRIVSDVLPKNAAMSSNDIDLQDVYLYYLEQRDDIEGDNGKV